MESLQKLNIIPGEKKELDDAGSVKEMIDNKFKDFPKIEEKIKNYEKAIQEKFSTNEKIEKATKDRFKNEVVTESIPFYQLENNQPIQFEWSDKKNLADNLYKDIKVPDKFYDEIVINKNDLIRKSLANNIIGPEIEKAFGNPPTFLLNSDGESYKIITIDKFKLTPENIKKFHESVNEKLQAANDKLIVINEVMEEVKKQKPNLNKNETTELQNELFLSKLDVEHLKNNKAEVATSLNEKHEKTIAINAIMGEFREREDLTEEQINKYQNALSKIDTQHLQNNKDQMVSSLNDISNKSDLSFLEKGVTYFLRIDQVKYFNKKVDKLLDKKFGTLPQQNTTSPQHSNYKSSIQTPAPEEIKKASESKIVTQNIKQQSKAKPLKPGMRVIKMRQRLLKGAKWVSPSKNTENSPKTTPQIGAHKNPKIGAHREQEAQR